MTLTTMTQKTIFGTFDVIKYQIISTILNQLDVQILKMFVHRLNFKVKIDYGLIFHQ